MSPLDFALDGLTEDGAFSAIEEEVFVLSMVEHLDCIALEHILQFVVLQHIVGFPAFLVD